LTFYGIIVSFCQDLKCYSSFVAVKEETLEREMFDAKWNTSVDFGN